MTLRLVLVVCLLLLVPTVGVADLFREQIAPILETRCLSCHDATKKRGGLDLSSHKGFLTGSDEGKIVLPGRPMKSRLIEVVSGSKPRMPRTGPKLTDKEIAHLVRWIEDGAVWPAGVTLKARTSATTDTWWSLRPVVSPSAPRVKQTQWVRTPIDTFVLAELEKRGLQTSPEADRRTLIRRATYALTGLPPTPEEIQAFVEDTRLDAWQRVVDRLLASPAYGERWGRHWLDVAHYGDTHGYDKDKRRDNAWPYRDWVINAFNLDLPYRLFIQEQLAGDVLHPGEAKGLIATGFVVAGPWDFVGQVELREGTVDKEKTRLLDRDDMVSTALGSFMSLTIGCARCHDHKFDPIPMEDYYRLQAVFSGVERGNRLLREEPGKEQKNLLAEKNRLLQLRRTLDEKRRAVQGPGIARLDQQREQLLRQIEKLPLPRTAVSRSNGYHSGILPTPDHVRWVQVDLGTVMPIEEIRLFPARPVDFRDTPGFGFPVRFRVEISDEETFTSPRMIADHTRADYPNPGEEPILLSGKGLKGRYVRVTATRLWKRTNDYVFALAELQVESGGKNVAQGAKVTSLDSIEAGLWSRRHLVDGFNSRRKLPDLAEAMIQKQFLARAKIAEELRQLSIRREQILNKRIPEELRKQATEVEQLLAAVEARLKAAPKGPMVYSVVSIPARQIHVLRRGDVEQKKEAVTAAGLACLKELNPTFTGKQGDSEGERRLALAKWISDPKNPLTWRSIVNRLWHYHFGRGIVDTPNDFGKMGGRPTHPELLDWLADEFRNHDGSLKHIHRMILLSSTYQQVSRHNEEVARLDSDNRYLWRMNRHRLDAECVRDAALAVSGQLDRSMGGPGYDLFRFKDDHSPVYDHSELAKIYDPKTYRRTVYRFTVRSVPNPFLDSLDCADPNLSTPVRNTTLTALQALALLNNPFMVRQSILFAERLQREQKELSGQLTMACRLVFGRDPTQAEREDLQRFAQKHGLSAVCRILLNANEFVFVD